MSLRPLMFAAAVGLSCLAGCADSRPQSELERGQAAFESGHWAEAIAACSEAIGENPTDAAAYLCRGRAFHCQGELEKAIADFTEAIRLKPENHEAYYQRANAYRDGGQAELYAADEHTARQLDPAYRNAFLFVPSTNVAAEELDELSHSVNAGTAGDHAGPTDLSTLPGAEPKSRGGAAVANEPQINTQVNSPARDGRKDEQGRSVDDEPRSKTEELLGIDLPRSASAAKRAAAAAAERRAGETSRRARPSRGSPAPQASEEYDPPALTDREDQQRGAAMRDAELRAQSTPPRRSLTTALPPDPRAYAAPSRPLHPYGPSSMRSTGVQSQPYGPYGQLPGDGAYSGGGYSGQGGAYSRGGYAPNPYAPNVRTPNRYGPAVPNTYLPPVPGLRDDVGP